MGAGGGCGFARAEWVSGGGLLSGVQAEREMERT